jgi:hypothetical protein
MAAMLDVSAETVPEAEADRTIDLTVAEKDVATTMATLPAMQALPTDIHQLRQRIMDLLEEMKDYEQREGGVRMNSVSLGMYFFLFYDMCFRG